MEIRNENYVKNSLKSVLKISGVYTVHYFKYGKNFSVLPEKHDFWEMVYVDKGKVIVKRNEEEILLNQGDVIFHKPNEFHAIKAYQSEPNFFVMSFSCDSPSIMYLEKYHTKLDGKLKPFISAIIEETESTFIIPKNDTTLKKLTLKKDSIIGGEQLIKTYLEQLLILLIRKINEIGSQTIFPNKEHMENHLILSIKQFLENNVENQLKISDVCKNLGYGKSFLSKIFHDQTGTTIVNYFNQLKIKHAKQLIRENNLNFSQISDKLQFDNPQYFSRVFKRITGMTPSEFKLTLNLNT